LVLWLRSSAAFGGLLFLKIKFKKVKIINHGSRIRITACAPAFFPPVCNGKDGREFREKILALVLNRYTITAGGQYYPALFAG